MLIKHTNNPSCTVLVCTPHNRKALLGRHVTFMHKKQVLTGEVTKANQKTLKVTTTDGRVIKGDYCVFTPLDWEGLGAHTRGGDEYWEIHDVQPGDWFTIGDSFPRQILGKTERWERFGPGARPTTYWEYQDIFGDKGYLDYKPRAGVKVGYKVTTPALQDLNTQDLSEVMVNHLLDQVINNQKLMRTCKGLKGLVRWTGMLDPRATGDEQMVSGEFAPYVARVRARILDLWETATDPERHEAMYTLADPAARGSEYLLEFCRELLVIEKEAGRDEGYGSRAWTAFSSRYPLDAAVMVKERLDALFPHSANTRRDAEFYIARTLAEIV